MSNIMVFDIETVPNVEGGRRVYGLEGLSLEAPDKPHVAEFSAAWK